MADSKKANSIRDFWKHKDSPDKVLDRVKAEMSDSKRNAESSVVPVPGTKPITEGSKITVPPRRPSLPDPEYTTLPGTVSKEDVQKIIDNVQGGQKDSPERRAKAQRNAELRRKGLLKDR